MGQRARTYGSKDGSDVLGLVRIRVRLVTYLSSLAKRESSLVRRTAEDHPLSFPFRAHVSGLRARRRTKNGAFSPPMRGAPSKVGMQKYLLDDIIIWAVILPY